MNLFAIADLHLSTSSPKPMDIFGDHWGDHWAKIQTNWRTMVTPEDIVLIPGDISWAMNLEDADADLQMLADLPGRKIILRGNHDYWWPSLARLSAYEKDGIFTLQNNAFRFAPWVICGSRGWISPGNNAYSPATDEKIYRREAIRLRLSLDAGKRLLQEGDELLVMMHYPPLCEQQEHTMFTQLFQEYGVKTVLYGHLHGPSFPWVYKGVHDGVAYHLVSCDYLHFAPKLIIAS